MRILNPFAAALLALSAFSTSALAETSLLAEYDRNGGVTFEFVGGTANAVAGIQIELTLKDSIKGATVAEDCLQAPRGFTALCNIDGNTFKAVVFSMNPDLVLPSGSLGRVQFPQNALNLAKSGEVQGLGLKTYDGMAKAVPSEVLSAPKGADRGGHSQQER